MQADSTVFRQACSEHHDYGGSTQAEGDKLWQAFSLGLMLIGSCLQQLSIWNDSEPSVLANNHTSKHVQSDISRDCLVELYLLHAPHLH